METNNRASTSYLEKHKNGSKGNLLVKLRALKGNLKLHLALSSARKIPKGYQSVPESSLLGQSIMHAKEGDIINIANFSPPYPFLVLYVSD